VQEDVDRTKRLYDACPFGDFCYREQRAAHNRPLARFLAGARDGDQVFDIGCGTGFWLESARRLGKTGVRLWGVDLSPASASRVRGRGFQAMCGNVLELPLQDSVSDRTVCNGVLHHTPDALGGLRELARITKAEGRLFLGVYNAWNPYFYVLRAATWPLRHAYWRGHTGFLDALLRVGRRLLQPAAVLLFKTPLDEETARTLVMDQVLNPHARLFTMRALRRYARQCGCEIERFQYAAAFTLLTAVLLVGKRPCS